MRLNWIVEARTTFLLALAFWAFAGFLLNSGAQAEFGLFWLSTSIAVIISLVGLAATLFFWGLMYEPN